MHLAYPVHIQHIQFDHRPVALHLPDLQAVKSRYEQMPGKDFPYWARLWPAALALSRFVDTHPKLIQNKKVLELAGGLGLPSLVAAQWASEVCCTDYAPEAIGWMQLSAKANGCTNFAALEMDWNYLPEDIHADVLLLSDINYEPAVFETLFKVLTSFLDKGTLIMLSTPQRLMAKPFIERLLPFCIAQHNEIINLDGSETATSVFVLRGMMLTN
ncbi:Predicted nicotinamide N-methyase [Cnuella takakiae]|uniref:Predicted nicotinamide N-methyase n=1 Tax=Cnuella takakiae TaxID=1302690 RepID=A0A1M4VCR7_9BACT|nr:hypothetical protein [Cnuella takakiae]OLY92637.1 hypothetical protein BUE76_12615 [Cnuella takakiae]SHE66794.1 Predicted nicotinamide N-methyase [Cnuella takakiae]